MCNMANEALLIIDYTNDFIHDNGNLTIGKSGQKIGNYIVNLANTFNQQRKYVIFPTDLHELNNSIHPEHKLFPPHNIRNTWGREFYGLLNTWYNQHKNDATTYLLDKQRYSSFTGTSLDLFLRERNIDTIHLVGVCTDICILHTAIDAYNLNYQIIIHERGVAGTSIDNHNWAINHCKNTLNSHIR